MHVQLYPTDPVETSHILMVLSLDVETRKSPEGMKATLDTLWSCPCSVLMHSYVVKSHSRMDMSAEQEARGGGRERGQEGERERERGGENGVVIGSCEYRLGSDWSAGWCCHHSWLGLHKTMVQEH